MQHIGGRSSTNAGLRLLLRIGVSFERFFVAIQRLYPRAITNWIGTLNGWRRGNRLRVNRWLARLFGATPVRRRLLRSDTRRILVVRLNNRLGNLLFLTPMLRSLATALPEARIDVLVQNAAVAGLLQSLPGVDRIWIQEKRLAPTLALLWRMRRWRYDLAIDPCVNSASNRAALMLCRARQRMGFAAYNQWLSLSHASPRPRSPHQAIQSVELLAGAVDGLRFEAFDTLAITPDAAAREAAGRHWRITFGPRAPAPPVVGFFIQATGRKCLASDWWRRWLRVVRARMPEATLLQICPPDEDTALVSDIAHIAIPDLAELAAALARLDVFVAADGGPMHLGAAAGVPVVGLFQATSAERYAPLGAGCVSLTAPELQADTVADTVRRVWDSRRADALAAEG